MRIDVVTIFPDYLAPLEASLIGKAQERGILDVHVHDLRQWATDVHRTVDDSPSGGGPGMVMKPDVWGRALDAVYAAGPSAAGRTRRPRLIIPTPGGQPFTQQLAGELAAESWLIFACGRYEGIDARVVDDARARLTVDELSIGDYVLAGGEAAALVIVEAATRLLPGVLGNADSAADDSFASGPMSGLIEAPVYTKPPVWRDRMVPEVLLSGNHAAIARWRRDEALRRTAAVRPDLIERLAPGDLDVQDRAVLAEAGWAVIGGRFSPTAPGVPD